MWTPTTSESAKPLQASSGRTRRCASAQACLLQREGPARGPPAGHPSVGRAAQAPRPPSAPSSRNLQYQPSPAASARAAPASGLWGADVSISSEVPAVRLPSEQRRGSAELASRGGGHKGRTFDRLPKATGLQRCARGPRGQLGHSTAEYGGCRAPVPSHRGTSDEPAPTQVGCYTRRSGGHRDCPWGFASPALTSSALSWGRETDGPQGAFSRCLTTDFRCVQPGRLPCTRPTCFCCSSLSFSAPHRPQ